MILIDLATKHASNLQMFSPQTELYSSSKIMLSLALWMLFRMYLWPTWVDYKKAITHTIG